MLYPQTTLQVQERIAKVAATPTIENFQEFRVLHPILNFRRIQTQMVGVEQDLQSIRSLSMTKQRDFYWVTLYPQKMDIPV